MKINNCTVSDYSVHGDKDNRLKTSVKEVAKTLAGGVGIEPILASYFRDVEFVNELKENFKVDNILKINANSLRKKLKERYIKLNPSVIHTTTINHGEELGGFTSAEAKSIAKEHTADIIIRLYYENKSKTGKEKLNNDKLLENVRKEIANNFAEFYYKPFINKLVSENENLKQVQKLLGLNKEIEELINVNKKIKELNKTELSSKEETEKLITEFKNNNNKLIQLKAERKAIVYNLIDKYGSIPEQNYKNLLNKLEGNSDSWFKEVFTISKLFSITEQFKDNSIDESNIDFLNDFDEINPDETSIDHTTKTWSDKNQNSFTKLLEGDLRLYFESLFHLNTPIPTTGEDITFDYNTSNPLGVSLSMGANFVMAQLLNNKTDYSVEDFINSIDKASKSNKNLYGLSKLVRDMKKNRVFANKVFSTICNFKIDKSMINITESGVEMVHSNPNSDPTSYIINNMLNNLKSTYRTAYEKSTVDRLKKALIDLTTFKNNKTSISFQKRFNNVINIETLNELLEDSLFRVFPNLDSNGVFNYINNGNDRITAYYNLINLTNTLFSQINNIINDYNKEVEKVKHGYTVEEHYDADGNLVKQNEVIGLTKWYALKSEAETVGEEFNIPKPKLDYSKIRFERADNIIIEIAKLVKPYTVSNNDLNSLNAEDNLSSDIIKNNHITNIIKQIEYGTDEDSFAGLNRLKEFITKSSQYDHSLIFYGLQDNTGKTIVEGLFNKRKDGTVIVNPNAKKIIHFTLFNGTKNLINNKSVMYDGMSGLDYFITQLITLNTPLKHKETINDKNSDLLDNYINLFLRIPSDAPKNFTVQLPRFKTSTLFTHNDKMVNEKVKELTNKIKDILSKENSGYITYYGIVELLGQKENFVDIERLYQLLTDNNVTIPIKDVNILKQGNSIKIPFQYNISENNAETFWFTAEKDNKGNYINLKYDGVAKVNSNIDTVINKMNTVIKNEVLKSDIEKQINKHNPAFLAAKQILLGELNNFIINLNNVFEIKDNKFVLKKNTNGLFDFYHHNKGEIIKDGELVGKVFHIEKLFDIDGFSAEKELFRHISPYGGNGNETLEPLIIKTKSGEYELNINRTDLIKIEDGVVKLNIDNNIHEALVKTTEKWYEAYNNYIERMIENKYKSILEENYISSDVVKDFAFNATISYANMDDLFEGDIKFYKDPQTALKRAKEVQSGGLPFTGFNFSDEIGGDIKDVLDEDEKSINITIRGKIVNLPTYNGVATIKDKPLTVRNGFRAITISNTSRPSDNAAKIKESVYNSLISKMSPERAEKISNEIAKGYFAPTTINDAQSYITLEEFIRRKYADGTLLEYESLLVQLLDDNIPIEKIDLSDVRKKVQVQKNYYYDIAYDDKTRTYYPRQIKNAEFVLIPKLIKGTELEELYNIMKKHDIGQVNTKETSKAANHNVLEFWDNNKVTHGKELDKSIKESVIERYYYKSLTKQQDVVDHMIDKRNKAGIQIMKKIIDNATPAVQPHIEKFIKNYSANIKASFRNLIHELGWKVDYDGSIVNKDDSPNIDMDKFYEKARLEAQRLGMDSNFIEYLTLDILGNPIMPNFMNNVSLKLESIAQSIFNTKITRQTLNGWHVPQVSSLGIGETALTENGVKRTLRYHPENENGSKPYIEVLLPRNSKLIPKDYDIKKLEKEGLDLHIGYRIPTEGKQSVAIMKVVGFVNEIYGSTIFVPDEWVTQTSSDFDFDTVYGISFNMYRDKDKILHKIKSNYKEDENSIKLRYIDYVRELTGEKITIEEVDDFEDDRVVYFAEFYNWDLIDQQTTAARSNDLLDTMIDIMSHSDSIEENYSRSNFDDLLEAKNEVESLLGLTDDKANNVSFYNPFTQIDFMENSVSGMRLKAESVLRDTFNSISNYSKAELKKGNQIIVEYSVDEYDLDNAIEAYGLYNYDTDTGNVVCYDENNKIIKDAITNKSKVKTFVVRHGQWGWSNNNRNIVGKLLTPYSSQTTAHILDVIKAGTIINENNYTFKTFKTFIDVGVDFKTAIYFLGQPAVSSIVAAYHKKNSLYSNNNSDPIQTALFEYIEKLGYNFENNNISKYTSITNLMLLLASDKGFVQWLSERYGSQILGDNSIKVHYIRLSKNALRKRLEQVKNLNNSEINIKEQIYQDIVNVLYFKRVNDITNNVSKVTKVINPDKAGAKTTIRETQTFVDTVQQYGYSDEAYKQNVLFVNNKPFLAALYPLDKDGKIDYTKSCYPNIAAFYQFATIPSISINRQLFDLESSSFNMFFNYVQTKIGKILSEKDYLELKRYFVNYNYSQIPVLNDPVTIDKNGNIIEDIEKIKENTENDEFYWNTEHARILGIDVKESSGLEIQDVNNPTEEELSAFKNLTPAQKVMWIQMNFKGDLGIFGDIKVNLFNNNGRNNIKPAKQIIKINDQQNYIEEMILKFNEVFFNKNVLIKLAAVDLIKYAFIADGFKFGRGSISKIISNKSMYNDRTRGGMDIITMIKDNVKSVETLNPSEYENLVNKFTLSYIKSHPENIKELVIPNFRKHLSINDKILIQINKFINKEGIIYIPYTKETSSLLDALTINTENTKDFIRLTKKVNKTNKVTTLYKIKTVERTGVFLYPLNTLDNYETSEISLNFENNKHRPEIYYETLINHVIEEGSTLSSLYDDKGNFILEEYKKLKDATTIKPIKLNKVNELSNNEKELERLLENGTKIQQNDVKVFKKKIIDLFNNPISKYGITDKIIIDNNNTLFNAIKEPKQVVQEILDENLTPTKISIKLYDIKTMRPVLRNFIKTKSPINYIKLNKFEKLLADKILEYNSNSNNTFSEVQIPNIYIVERVLDKKGSENHNNAVKEDAEIREDELFAISGEIGTSTRRKDIIYDDFDTTATQIYNNMRKKANSGNLLAKDFIRTMNLKGINFNNGIDIHNNRNSIYRAAADYYKHLGDHLLSEIDGFRVSEDKIFSIDDPKLYKELLTDDAAYSKLVKLILEAKTFAKQFDILSLDVTGEDEITSKAIQELKDIISKVRNNVKLKTALNKIFNDYIAKEYANNPVVKNNLVELTTQFGDIDWFDLNFSDVAEIPHKQIQAVTKFIHTILNKAIMVEAPENVRRFIKDFEEIEQIDSIDWDKIIDKNAKFITDYKEKFIEDYNKFKEELKQIEENNPDGAFSLEYQKKKLELDKWKLQNTNQQLVDEYYQRDIELKETILREAPDEYIEYIRLQNELNKNKNNNFLEDSDAEIERRNIIKDKINKLLLLDMNTALVATEEMLFKVEKLSEYIKAKKQLNLDYFSNVEIESFRSILEDKLNFIKKYDRNYPNDNIEEKLTNDEYRSAYNWIKMNTIYRLNDETNDIINKAFKSFANDNSTNKQIKTILIKNKAFDEYGRIDPRKLSKELLIEIKKITQGVNITNGESLKGSGGLIKEVPKDLPLFTSEFYDIINGGKISNVVIQTKKEIIKQINEVFEKGINQNTGKIDSLALFKNTTPEERQILINGYIALNNIKSGRGKAYFERLEKIANFKTNREAFIREYHEAKQNLSNKEFLEWISIYAEHDKHGEPIVADNEDGVEFVANRHIFGYIEPKDESHIDIKRTEAKKILIEDVQYVPTEYYYIARDEAIKNGTYKEWYELNHYYNQYTQKIEPLKIWTSITINPNSKLNKEYIYLPTYNNTERKVKDDNFLNKNYKEKSYNYNKDKGSYNNDIILNEAEQKMINLLKTILQEYSTTYSAKNFVNRGFLPRRRQVSVNNSWYIKQVFGAIGFEIPNERNARYDDKIGYEEDYDVPFDMMKLLKAKGYKNLLPLPNKENYNTEEEYKKAVEDVNKKNKEIYNENLKLDNEIIDRNWKDVFKDYITKATEYNARQRVKNTMYLLLEDLKDREAIKTNLVTKRVTVDRSKSTRDFITSKSIVQNNAVTLWENYIRRVVFAQHKKNNPLNKYAALLQNITSSKYMIFNLPGGIANISIGLTNIFNEVFSKEYFNPVDFRKAQGMYNGNILNFFADLYKDSSSNLAVTLTKYYDVVDYDAFTEHKSNTDIIEYSQRIKEGLYSMQTMGEHYMQNTVLFAVLKSHRIYKDDNGKYTIGNLTDYLRNIERTALKQLFKNNEDLIKQFKSFELMIKQDKNELRKYDSFNKDIHIEFIKIFGDKNMLKEFIKIRENIAKTKKAEFENYPTIESQYKIIDGRLQKIDNTVLTADMEGMLRNKVISINKKIHGVYDKMGAALIEREWWGSLAMQYHKHIYPGLMKRYRTKGIYNENRDSVEKGSYVSLAKLLSAEFSGIKYKIKRNVEEENGNVILESTKSIARALLDTALNLNLNYKSMTDWERRNVRRVLGDLLGIISAMLFGTLIYGLTDDDELKEDETLATALYLCDRLVTESFMYSPIGLYTEAKTLWSSPIAAQNSIADAIKAISIIGNIIIDDEYNPYYTTGLYKDDHKLKVILYRNTPALRVYNRLSNMTKNNKYYRLNDNRLNMKTSRQIADIITGEEDNDD